MTAPAIKILVAGSFIGLALITLTMNIVNIRYGLPDPEYGTYGDAHPIRWMAFTLLWWMFFCAFLGGLVLIAFRFTRKTEKAD